MKTIYVARSRHDIEHFFRRETQFFASGRLCISHGELPGNVTRILQARGFEISRPASLTGLTPEEFIREYVEMIGRLSQVNDCRLWWATDIATKNRFTCKLPEAMELLAAAMNAGRGGRYEEIVVLSPFAGFEQALTLAAGRDEFQVRRLSSLSDEVLAVQAARWRRQFSLVSHALRILLRAALIRLKIGRRLRQELAALARPVAVVKSFVYAHCFDGKGGYRDEFFGALPDALNKQEPVVILADILGPLDICCRRIATCTNHTIVPLEYFASWSGVFKALRDIITFHVYIPESTSFAGFSAAPLIRAEMTRTLNGLRIYHVMHEEYVRGLLKQVKANRFIYTYENNPWERMCVRAVRQQAPAAKIVGYQHAIVAEASLNLFFGEGEAELAPLPDRILTVGEITRGIMERYGRYRPGMLEPACALRYEYLFNQPPAGRTRRGHILLALGASPEVADMARYVLKQIGKDPAYRIRIRPHPYLAWSYFSRRLGIDLSRYPQAELSQGGDLRADLKWADTVMYWESTVGLEALSIGKPVIHFNRGELVSFDPLASCPYLRREVTGRDELVPLLASLDGMTDEDFNREQHLAGQFLAEYFYMNSRENMAKFAPRPDARELACVQEPFRAEL